MRVVGGDEGADDGDTRRDAIERGGAGDEGLLAGDGAARSSVITTFVAGAVAMLATKTVYSSCEPGSAAPPPTTVTSFAIESCWPPPTTTTVGSGPVAGLPSPSVRTFGSSAVVTRAWFVMSVPAGVPAFTEQVEGHDGGGAEP